ncbi:GNAT family N-acetyltransferase [Pedobacter montanisoli]|uniref:N-acetyltransferase n=1 Tax=Pedobacter montanisoli TaxID=2923277 RepID=A0ABS9ZRH1_9SPHI|nr:GNAT family N-acetyltransferase [Pedobacter montanisoli]MCJ0741186.1 N-acetyltransferase [Pedobacter montanisoli]
MEVQQFNREHKGFFKAVDNDQEAGLMTYTWAGPEKMIIDHTEVNENFSGKGVGRQLVEAAVKYAREQHIKIIPLCPYAKSVFDKTPDYADVLA